MRPTALVRGVPDSFDRALAAVPPDPAIDVARARVQHAAYAGGLVTMGLDVVVVAADESCPDCCFVEDTAVVAGGVALLTRPGAPSRRAEVNAVARALAERGELARMEAPATLDGGDCLRLGNTFYVGRSSRTNEAGVARMREVFGRRGFRVVAVALPPGILHLKSVCSPLGDDTVLVAEGTLPPSIFAGARALIVPKAEAHAANVVAFGGTALMAAGCPGAQSLVEAAGWRTIAVDTSELRKADGALTCLSVLLD